MARLMLNDELWSKLKTIMRQYGIYDKSNLRIMVEGMFYRMRVGCPSRDLPKEFGNWNSIYQKFNRWSSKDKLIKIFKSLVQEPDLEWTFIEGKFCFNFNKEQGVSEMNMDELSWLLAGLEWQKMRHWNELSYNKFS